MVYSWNEVILVIGICFKSWVVRMYVKFYMVLLRCMRCMGNCIFGEGKFYVIKISLLILLKYVWMYNEEKKKVCFFCLLMMF